MIDPSPRPRPMRVAGTWGYLSSTVVQAGSSVSVHVSAEADHEISLIRLGTQALLDPAQSLSADRAEATELASWHRPASPHHITPGSCIVVGGAPLPGGEMALGCWVRLWALPELSLIQFGLSTVIADINYPDRARVGLMIDHLGQICVYCGDNGSFRHAHLRRTQPVMGSKLGQWVFIAAVITATEVLVYLDGELFERFAGASLPDPTPECSLTLGAQLEHGLLASLLDGDIARPFVSAALSPADVAAVYVDCGRSAVAELVPVPIHAAWPLVEETGDRIADESGNHRHGHIVNHATWMIGGPAFKPENRRPGGYMPGHDPDRGHGLRLSSDDLVDAGWPATVTLAIPDDFKSGIYGVRIRLVGQSLDDSLTLPLVVSRRRPGREGVLAVLAATNTWHAYGRRPCTDAVQWGLSSSLYGCHRNGRPYFYLGKHLPIPFADPFRYESHRSEATRSTHLVRTERQFTAWLSQEGYEYEVISDDDLDADPALLTHFAALAIVGHSEYWSQRAKDGVEAYLAGGGKVVSLSGDTMSARVSCDGDVIECRKTVDSDDQRWLTPANWGESWHSQDGNPGGSYRRFGQAPYELLGLSFKGMIDDGTPTSFASYTVLKPDHFLMVDPYPVVGDAEGRIGTYSLNGRSGASGYEFDAVPTRTRTGEIPAGLTVLASALGQRNIEWLGDPDHGADLIHWLRPAGGEVVNFGSIASGGALPVDAGMANLVRNVLSHFAIAKEQTQ